MSEEKLMKANEFGFCGSEGEIGVREAEGKGKKYRVRVRPNEHCGHGDRESE